MSQEMNMADGSPGDSVDERRILGKFLLKTVDPVSIMGSVTREEYFKFPKRGKCYIFNHKFFDTGYGLAVREGTDVDADRLHLRFEALGFETEVYNDVTVREVHDTLRKAAKEDHSEYSAFVCCILSHGAYGILYARDGLYPTENVFAPFRGDACSTLLGKPKMFFIQACQADRLDLGSKSSEVPKESTEATSQYKIPSHADFLIMYSSVPGSYSWRNTINGSWFIQALCAALEEHAHNKDLLQILTVVNRKVSYEFEINSPYSSMKKMKSVPYITSTLTRNVKFT